MKKLVLTLLLSTLFVLSNAQLIITGVIDGPLTGGLPKAVELYVSADIADMSIYGLGSANNGGGSNGEEFTFPADSYTAGDFVYVASEATEFQNWFGFAPDYTDSAANVNGDDAIELFQNSSVIDVFGDINQDGTGEPWEYMDGWAYRNDTTGPDGSTFVLSSWSFSGPDALDGETSNATATTPFPTGTYSPGTGNLLPVIANITQTPDEDIISSTTVSVSADVTDSDGTITLVELHWGLVSGTLGNTISMDNGGSGDTYTTTSDIPAQADDATVYYEIYAEDDVPESSTAGEYSYTVQDPATTTLPYYETFDADLGDCYTSNVAGPSKEWIHNDNWAQMNGYNSGDPEEDWLILPGVNFGNYAYVGMLFNTWYRFGSDDDNNYLKLYYSGDYPGLGDPLGSTWTEIPFTHPTTEQSWESSGLLDLSTIPSTMIYIAFKYLYEPGNYRWWEVDDISLIDEPPLPITLSSFTTALILNEYVAIEWVTESEVNMSHFNLYRDDLLLYSVDATNSTMTTTYNYEDGEIEDGETYSYLLEAVHLDLTSTYFGPSLLTVEFDEPEVPEVPTITRLKGNHPNPFNPETIIEFTIKGGETGALKIYNTKGQLLEEHSFTPGDYDYNWNANKYGSGVYLYELQTESYTEIKKMVMTK